MPSIPRLRSAVAAASLALLCLTAGAQAADQHVVQVAAPAPQEPISTQFTLKADNQEVPVYLASVLAMTPEKRQKTDLRSFADGDVGQTSFASFDFQGETHLSITSSVPITSAKLLPTSSGIMPQVTGNTVTFSVLKPGQFVLEINGDTVHCLQIFADPLETNVPSATDSHVIYYGPGIHKVTGVTVTSGQTVYLAGGAVIYATPSEPAEPIFKLAGDNITLCGRGIIDGSLCPHGPLARNMIEAEGHHITIEGVILRDSGQWNLPITGSDQVAVKNIKIFGYRGNSDGIDINGSRNVDVRDCYLRTADDLVVVKTKFSEKGESQDITVEHCVLWNELAHALSLGAEIRKDITSVHFSDCDIIHDMGREWLLRVYQCDSAHVSDVTFQDIRAEECRRLISLWIGKAVWSRTPDRGHIDNITFQNITTPVPTRAGPPVVLMGFDADHAIHDVKLNNIVIGGQPLQMSGVEQNPFVSGVVVTP